RADVAEPARAGPGSCGLPREQVGVLGVLGDVLVDVPAGGQHGVARATGLVEGELHDLARDALAAELREGDRVVEVADPGVLPLGVVGVPGEGVVDVDLVAGVGGVVFEPGRHGRNNLDPGGDVPPARARPRD